eukprot:TRINITY_DN6375_c0_g1_i2.p1 TRINITY_DN6375_c0_g1~~TRINITY_DN6375_c0_g1_i2.p1  ORF type:complete len:165 (-),score=68.70 TRINITY_DN6375_c0_g1_i2:916-1371(-)
MAVDEPVKPEETVKAEEAVKPEAMAVDAEATDGVDVKPEDGAAADGVTPEVTAAADGEASADGSAAPLLTDAAMVDAGVSAPCAAATAAGGSEAPSTSDAGTGLEEDGEAGTKRKRKNRWGEAKKSRWGDKAPGDAPTGISTPPLPTIYSV